MAVQQSAESMESVAKSRQLELLFVMKEQLDLVYRQMNHFRNVCKSVDRLNRAVSKKKKFDHSPNLSIEYWKFKRTYSRNLKRKIRQIDRKMFDVNLYDKLYDLYESLIIIDEREEPITVMEGDDNDNDDHNTIGLNPDANLASSDKDLNFVIIPESLETFETPTEIPFDLIDDCQNSTLDTDDSEMNQFDPKLFRCNRNGCVFSTKHQQYFDDHLQVHNSEFHPRFQCGWKECHYSTNRLNHFKTHQVVHSKERPFQCMQCDKSFKLRYCLTAHMKTHLKQTKLPRFQCRWQGYEFSADRKRDLKRQKKSTKRTK